MAYEVHLDVFDGPFELLLQLITAQEVDLYEVPLATIVDAFLAEVARMGPLDLETATQFLLIAATLVELKCRRLLPGPDDIDLDEDLSLYEARDYLLARLLECRTFNGAAHELAALEVVASRSVPRRVGPDERFEGCAPDLLARITPADLLEAAQRALEPRPVVHVVETAHAIDDEVSVASVIGPLAGEVRRLGRASFRTLTASLPSTAHRVAFFLALLELYKQALVEIEQAESFGEIGVSWTGGDAEADLGLDLDDYDQLATARRGGER